MKPGFGFVLQADPSFLALTRRIVEEFADYLVVSPETTWENEFGRVVRDLRRASAKPFVGHGLDFSPGSAVDPPHTAEWLQRIARDHADLDFGWYSEHLGFTRAEAAMAYLPLPLPYTDEALQAVARRMARLREIVPIVAVENQASLFSFSDPRTEPAFLNRIAARGIALLLDFHNAYANSVNFSFDLDEWLSALDPDGVLEIHLSGGSMSEPAWLKSRRVFRLDSHDGPVPEPVWRALERHLPRFRNLRGVTLERLDGTLGTRGQEDLEGEARRLREVIAACR